MANRSPAVTRLQNDYRKLKKEPEPYIQAEPNPQNILNWHYVITGPPDTPYENGFYHGLLKFPKEYPFKPPSIIMYTPNGRFSTNTRLCLPKSDYHPECWNPTWSVGTILTGLVSFMVGTETSACTTQSSDTIKQKLALESFDWCTSRSTSRGRVFNQLFEDFVEEELEKRRQKQLKEARVNCAELLQLRINKLQEKMEIDEAKLPEIERIAREKRIADANAYRARMNFFSVRNEQVLEIETAQNNVEANPAPEVTPASFCMISQEEVLGFQNAMDLD